MPDPAAPPPAAPPATPPPAAPSNWRDSLPDDLKANDTLATVPDVPTLAKNYLATKAMTGRKAYDLPDANWKPEQWKEWNKAIGVPDAPDKYSPVDKELIEKAGVKPEVLSAATGKFHELGLTDRQTRGILDWFLGDTANGLKMQNEAKAAERAQGESALKQEWGDKYEAKAGLLKAWLKEYADPEFVAFVDSNGLGSNPAFIKAIVKSGEKTLEDNSRMGIKSPLGGDADRASAVAEIEAMKSNRLNDRAYSEKFNDPKSEERQRWNKLHDIAFHGVKAA